MFIFLMIFCDVALWWSSLMMGTSFSVSANASKNKSGWKRSTFGRLWYKWCAGYNLSMSFRYCTEIWRVQTSFSTKTRPRSWVTWTFQSWQKMASCIPRRVHHTTPVPRSGRTSPMTSNQTFGPSAAWRMKCARWIHPSPRMTWMAFSEECSKVNSTLSPASTRWTCGC